jgi:uncharacterized membrane protein YkgB
VTLPEPLEPVDIRITSWMARHGVTLARISLGIVFLWFGALKFFPALSPAEQLAGVTIERLTFGVVKPSLGIPVLAVWESLIGIGLLSGRALRITLLLLFLQMIGTMVPLVMFPHETWAAFPIAPSLEGQYIIKNVVLISAAIVIGATVRGGRLTSRPPRGAPPPD